MEIAWSEEMQLMATRYELISDMLERGAVHYLCMSTARSFGGCNITDCSSDAWACPGVNAIFLCPGFWTGGAATSFRKIVETKNEDIWHLMNALGSLHNMYGLLRTIILGSLVLAVVAGAMIAFAMMGR